MKLINFNTTTEEDLLIGQIVKRAALDLGVTDTTELFMDLTATHCNGTPLDFQKLLDADDANFGHDIYGIQRHLDRTDGELKDCFLPRCSK